MPKRSITTISDVKQMNDSQLAEYVAKVMYYPVHFPDVRGLCTVIEKLVMPSGADDFTDVEMEGWIREALEKRQT